MRKPQANKNYFKDICHIDNDTNIDLQILFDKFRITHPKTATLENKTINLYFDLMLKEFIILYENCKRFQS